MVWVVLRAMFWFVRKAEDEGEIEGCSVEYLVDCFKVMNMVTTIGSLADAGVGVATGFGVGSPTTDPAPAEVLDARGPEVIVLPWSSNVSVVIIAVFAMKVTVCPSVCVC